MAGVVDQLEEALMATEAVLSRMQSIERSVDAMYFKRGDPCPFCHHSSVHAQTCYMRATTGWDLLSEHEATLRENDELRQALAVHLPNSAREVLQGKGYCGLKQRARNGSSKPAGATPRHS